VSEAPQLPRPRRLRSFVALCAPTVLHRARETTAFLEAIELLGPRGLTTSAGGLATLALPRPARHLRHAVPIHSSAGRGTRRRGDYEEVVRLQNEGRGDEEPPLAAKPTHQVKGCAHRSIGQSAASAERAERRAAPARAQPRRACRADAAIADARAAWALGRTCDETLRESTRSDGE